MKQGHFQCELETISRRKFWAKRRAAVGRARHSVVHDPLCPIMPAYLQELGAIPASILLPEGAPAVMKEAAGFWDMAESVERRVDSCVARLLKLGLPHEVVHEDRLACALEMGQYLVDRYRAGADIYYSLPSAKDQDPRNFRAYIFFTTREITAEGMGKKTAALDRGQGRMEILLMRKQWEDIENRMYERRGIDVRVDSRSRKAQEIEAKSDAVGQEPQ